MGLTLIRHTRPMGAEGLCYGRTDLDVAETFHAEARAVLAAAPLTDIIITSPLQRCRKLAQHIAVARGQDLQVDDRIQEMNFGNWEARLWADIPAAELDAWAADFLHARPHGGESVSMLRARTNEALTHYRTSGKTHLIVTHAGIIKTALSDGDRSENFSGNVDFGGMATLPLQKAIGTRDERK